MTLTSSQHEQNDRAPPVTSGTITSPSGHKEQHQASVQTLPLKLPVLLTVDAPLSCPCPGVGAARIGVGVAERQGRRQELGAQEGRQRAPSLEPASILSFSFSFSFWPRFCASVCLKPLCCLYFPAYVAESSCLRGSVCTCVLVRVPQARESSDVLSPCLQIVTSSDRLPVPRSCPSHSVG